MNPLRWVRWKVLAVLGVGIAAFYFFGLDKIALSKVNQAGDGSRAARWSVTDLALGLLGGGRRGGGGGNPPRTTGRGAPDDPYTVQGRPPTEAPPEPPRAEIWEAVPITDEQRRNNGGIIPPDQRPRVILRYADNRDLFVSGLLDGGDEIAQHPAVIDAPYGAGHVVLFSTNPFWRGQTKGSYFLVFNTILNFDSLNAGRKLAQ